MRNMSEVLETDQIDFERDEAVDLHRDAVDGRKTEDAGSTESLVTEICL